jgi:hypothetical protein
MWYEEHNILKKEKEQGNAPKSLLPLEYIGLRATAK